MFQKINKFSLVFLLTISTLLSRSAADLNIIDANGKFITTDNDANSINSIRNLASIDPVWDGIPRYSALHANQIAEELNYISSLIKDGTQVNDGVKINSGNLIRRLPPQSPDDIEMTSERENLFNQYYILVKGLKYPQSTLNFKYGYTATYDGPPIATKQDIKREEIMDIMPTEKGTVPADALDKSNMENIFNWAIYGEWTKELTGSSEKDTKVLANKIFWLQKLVELGENYTSGSTATITSKTGSNENVTRATFIGYLMVCVYRIAKYNNPKSTTKFSYTVDLKSPNASQAATSPKIYNINSNNQDISAATDRTTIDSIWNYAKSGETWNKGTSPFSIRTAEELAIGITFVFDLTKKASTINGPNSTNVERQTLEVQSQNQARGLFLNKFYVYLRENIFSFSTPTYNYNPALTEVDATPKITDPSGSTWQYTPQSLSPEITNLDKMNIDGLRNWAMYGSWTKELTGNQDQDDKLLMSKAALILNVFSNGSLLEDKLPMTQNPTESLNAKLTAEFRANLFNQLYLKMRARYPEKKPVFLFGTINTAKTEIDTLREQLDAANASKKKLAKGAGATIAIGTAAAGLGIIAKQISSTIKKRSAPEFTSDALNELRAEIKSFDGRNATIYNNGGFGLLGEVSKATLTRKNYLTFSDNKSGVWKFKFIVGQMSGGAFYDSTETKSEITENNFVIKITLEKAPGVPGFEPSGTLKEFFYIPSSNKELRNIYSQGKQQYPFLAQLDQKDSYDEENIGMLTSVQTPFFRINKNSSQQFALIFKSKK